MASDQESNHPHDELLPEPMDHEKLSEKPPEKSPGVYIRTGEHQPHELDILWSGSRQFVKEERSPVVFTVVGIMIGILVAGAVFFLVSSKPKITTGESVLTTPIVQESGLLPKEGDSTTQMPGVETELSHEAVVSVTKTPSTAPSPTSERSHRIGGKVYIVKNGDTLERIARQYYGSGTPGMIQKIVRANRLANPHRLQIGQKLVIPPKNY